jgi:hypothetical protein
MPSGSCSYSHSDIPLSVSSVFIPSGHEDRINGRCCFLVYSINGVPMLTVSQYYRY